MNKGHYPRSPAHGRSASSILGINRSLVELVVGAIVVFAMVLAVVSRLMPGVHEDGSSQNARLLTSSSGVRLDRKGSGIFTPQKRFLVAAASSCEDIVPKKWLVTEGEEDERPYDVLLFDYSTTASCRKHVREGPGLTLIHRPKTFKWPAMRSFFLSTEEGRRALSLYTHFLLSDDDVDYHTVSAQQPQWAAVAKLFAICEAADMHICQPSLSKGSAINFAATEHVPKEGVDEREELSSQEARVRLTGFVEQMAPVFSREALMQMLPFFKDVTHAWGIDALWSQHSVTLGRRVGVVDVIQIDHARKSGVSSLYKRVGGLEKAKADQDEFKARWQLKEDVFKAANTFGEGEVVVVTIPGSSQQGQG